MEHIMTCKEAADVLGIHPETVREMTRDGRIKKVCVTKRGVRIRPVDLQEFIDKRVKEGADDEVRPDKSKKGQR